jgi:hypothetical protein
MTSPVKRRWKIGKKPDIFSVNGEIAQIIALVCHGNAFLRGSSIPDFLNANSTSQFCESILFVQGTEMVTNPNLWFTKLRGRAVLGLRLSHVPRNDPNLSDRMSVAFVGGGGFWAIEVIGQDGYSQILRSQWEVGNRNAPNRRIWRVGYGQVGRIKTTNAEARPLIILKESLGTALREIHDFSKAHECEGFTKCFSNARESLSPLAPRHGHHKDLSVDGILSPDAMALLDSCQTAWVFGGMGSWNDMGFDGEEGREYDRVSENLFRLLCEIIPASANESFKPN